MEIAMSKVDFAQMRWMDLITHQWDRHDKNWGLMLPKDAQGNFNTAHPDWFRLVCVDNGFCGDFGSYHLDKAMGYFWADKSIGYIAAADPVASGSISDGFMAAYNLTALDYAKGVAFQQSDYHHDLVQSTFNSRARADDAVDDRWLDLNQNTSRVGSLYNTIYAVSDELHNRGVTSASEEFFMSVERFADDMLFEMNEAFARGETLLPRHFFIDAAGNLAHDITL
jgi:hypothetical protein